MSQTVVSFAGKDVRVNGVPTYPGVRYNGHRIEGLLMNSRMIQGVFDDLNPETRSRWDYPDGPWDPDRNTAAFVAAMPAWRAHGLIGFTVGLQGGSPEGYSGTQPWENSAFAPDGTPRPAYFDRLARILDAADRLGMVPIVSFFYFGQDQRLEDEAAVIRATDAATDWLLERGDRHVLVEINNECNVGYDHAVLQLERVPELITRVRERSAGKLATPAGHLLTAASFGGNLDPTADVVAASDYVTPHGNGVHEPDGIRRRTRAIRGLPTYLNQPIFYNEDDHFAFDQPDNNLLAAIGEGAGWGYFDFRMKKETDFREGYQSMPCSWEIDSARKRGFFSLLKEVTGR